MTSGCHGSTYGSNPLAMAVAGAVLDVMQQDGFFEHVNQMGVFLREGLESLAASYPRAIQSVRGMGLILGIQMKENARTFADYLRSEGLLVAPAYGDVLRFVPPLIVTDSEIEAALTILERALHKYPSK
jgi:acetylornithine/N-succinyldiaminopimelate aminotransferase